MIVQSRKIAAFHTWAGLEGNVDHVRRNKTAITSLIFDTDPGIHTPVQMPSKEVARIRPNKACVYIGKATSLHQQINLLEHYA